MVRRFVEAQRLAKQSSPEQWRIAMEMSKNTGLYPRDILTKAIMTGLLGSTFPDGSYIDRIQPSYEVPLFQGCSIYRTAAFAYTAAAVHWISWQAAEVNPLLMWDPSDPTVVEIPQGANIARFTGRIRTTTNTGDYMQLQIERVSPQRFVALPIFDPATGNWTGSLLADTGPVAVVPGEKYRMGVQCGSNRDMSGGFSNTALAVELGFIA